MLFSILRNKILLVEIKRFLWQADQASKLLQRAFFAADYIMLFMKVNAGHHLIIFTYTQLSAARRTIAPYALLPGRPLLPRPGSDATRAV
jgi:hypothetical protein